MLIRFLVNCFNTCQLMKIVKVAQIFLKFFSLAIFLANFLALMRFVHDTILVTFGLIAPGHSTVYDCQALCDSTDSCANDPSHHGSYCKLWQTPPTCFGLYNKRPGEVCFQPNDPSCPESSPVICARPTTQFSTTVVSTQAPATTISTFVPRTTTTVVTSATTTTPTITTIIPPVTDCDALCLTIPSCANELHAQQLLQDLAESQSLFRAVSPACGWLLFPTKRS